MSAWSTLKRVAPYNLKNSSVPTTLLFRTMVIYTTVVQNDSEEQEQRFLHGMYKRSQMLFDWITPILRANEEKYDGIGTFDNVFVTNCLYVNRRLCIFLKYILLFFQIFLQYKLSASFNFNFFVIFPRKFGQIKNLNDKSKF